MRPEHLKLAGIVTMLCGAMSPMVVGATNTDSPAMFAGRIIPLSSMTPDPAPIGIEDDAQDGSAGPQGSAPEVAQTNDADTRQAAAESGQAAHAATTGIADGASTSVGSAQSVQDAGQAANTVPESALVPMAATMPVASGAPVEALPDVAPAATADDDSLRGPDGPVVSVQDVVPLMATVPLARATGVTEQAPRAPEPDAVPDSAQASSAPAISQQDGSAPSSAIVDSGEVSGAPRAPAQNGASTTIDLAGSAREPNVAADNETSTPIAAKIEDSDRAWSSPDLVAVSDRRLDNMRGGFDLPSGLVVSFGISREAFVNGTPVLSTSFNIPNIAQMTPQQAQTLASANTSTLIQNGLNNTVQPGGLPALTGSVIQNTLNNQQIQALTTINTSVNSLSTFQAMNLSTTLNNALLNVVRPR